MTDDDASGLDPVALGLRAVREARQGEKDFAAWRERALERVRQGLDGRPAGMTWEDESIADGALPGTIVMLKTAVLQARFDGVDPEEFPRVPQLVGTGKARIVSRRLVIRAV